MTVILRKLSQKRNWDNVSWLNIGCVQADAIKCLVTCENKLSVFVLNDCDEQVERVVAALAAKRDYLTHIDLAIAPEHILPKCGIRTNSVKGETPDLEVNKWHQDLMELTTSKISQLAESIKLEGEIKRYQKSRVERAIKKSLGSNSISIERIGAKLMNSLRKHGLFLP